MKVNKNQEIKVFMGRKTLSNAESQFQLFDPGFGRLIRKIGLLLALLTTLSACATNWNPINWFSGDEVEEPAKLQAITQEFSLRRLWSVSVGNGQGGKYNLLTPALSGNAVFAASTSGEIVAVDIASGNVLWRNRTNETITGGVGAGNGLVMVGTQDAEVLVFDQSNGQPRWRTRVSSEVLSAPQTDGGIVVLQTVDDKLIALEASSGQQRWIYEATLPVLTLRGTSKPIISGSRVIAGFSNGTLVAVSAGDGIWAWEERVAVPQGRYDIERVIDIDGDLLLSGNVVLAASYQGNLMGLDVQSGRIVWGLEGSSYNGLAQGFGNIYYGNERSHVIAIRANSENVVWRNESLDLRQISAPAIVGSYVAVGDFEGYVHLISQVDGRVVSRYKVGSEGVRARPVANSNTLFVFSNDGRLTALALN